MNLSCNPKGLMKKWCILLALSAFYIIIIMALQKRISWKRVPTSSQSSSSSVCAHCLLPNSSSSANSATLPRRHSSLNYNNTNNNNRSHNNASTNSVTMATYIVTHSNNDGGRTHQQQEDDCATCNDEPPLLETESSILDEDHPTTILVIAYQRTGSSFFGQIFNHHTGSFFSFEPLDGVFSHLYGTMQGWNIPTDISAHKHGEHRSLSTDEHEAVLDTLASLLTCQMDKIPTEVLLHTFWSDFPKQHIHTTFYSHCLRALHINMRRCYMFLARSCPTYYQADSTQMLQCHNYLHHMPGDPIPISNYQRCLATFRTKAAPCISRLQGMCLKSTMRATKVVRPAMEVVPKLLERIPHLKVVHLVRDPRDVSVSRMLMQSAHSHLAEMELRNSHLWPPPSRTKAKASLDRVALAVPIEAGLFCNDVLADLDIYKKVKAKHPRSVIRLRYEDYISNPLDSALKVYQFVGLPMPGSLKKWLNSTVSTKSKWKWKTRDQALMGPYFQDVKIVCKEFYSILYPDLDS